jgi:peptidoglycan/LPS O-acetylase OafA/YrhL
MMADMSGDRGAVAVLPAPRTEKRRRRPRLTHVDAMRPIKQLGVVTTHSLQTFAPASAGFGVGAGLMMTHVTRFAFMFISSAMLVYAYPVIERGTRRTFWRRRLMAVGLPYLAWTLIYFALGLVQHGAESLTGDAEHLAVLTVTGYDQLYYLVVLLEFYLIYPAFLWLLRRTRRHHWWLLGCSLAVEVVTTWLVHEDLVPSWLLGKAATRELWNYQLYVVAGGVMAWHYQRVHGWVNRHWRMLAALALAAVALGEAWYALAYWNVPFFRSGYPSDPFQPVEVPVYLALIAAIYLLGMALGSERLPGRARALVRAGVDYSYGVYLSQVLFLSALSAVGWQRLDAYVPWELVVAGGVVIVFSAAMALTAVLARLPGARATAGIPRRRRPTPAKPIWRLRWP